MIIPREWAHQEAESGLVAQNIGPIEPETVDKIHSLIQEYVDTHPLVCGADPSYQRRECAEYVKMHYGLTGLEFLIWPIIAGAISWLVGRLLDRAYPKEGPTL